MGKKTYLVLIKDIELRKPNVLSLKVANKAQFMPRDITKDIETSEKVTGMIAANENAVEEDLEGGSSMDLLDWNQELTRETPIGEFIFSSFCK